MQLCYDWGRGAGDILAEGLTSAKALKNEPIRCREDKEASKVHEVLLPGFKG